LTGDAQFRVGSLDHRLSVPWTDALQIDAVSSFRIPPLNGGIHLNTLFDFPGPPQTSVPGD
jgi:hypothetical protein